jgi:ATP-binding cassette, subfamily B, bacterial MsbA
MLDRLRRLVLADRKSDLNLVLRVLNVYGRAHWRRFVVIIALMGIAAAATAGFAYLFAHVINDVYFRRNFADVVALALVIMFLFTAKGFANYGQAVMLARVGNRITAENQQRLYDKLVQEGMEYFADRHSSQFSAIYVQATGSASSVLNVVVLALGRDLMTLIGLLIVMVVQNPVLSLIAILAMPPAVIGVRKLVKRVKHLAMTQFSRGMNILQVIQETVQGFRVVKAFNLETAMRQRIKEDIASIEAASNKIARVSNRSGPMMETLGGGAIALVLLYGGFLIMKTGARPGEFVSFIGAFLLAYEPAKRIARMNVDLSATLVGLRILFDIIDSPPTEADDSDKPALVVNDGRIEFINVNFAYRPDHPVLRNTCFVAAPGQVTALVGPSGGGKSTIFSLLLDFYRAQSGAVAIDGQNLGDVTRKSVRGSIAYVGQEPFLFRGSIRDNIMCGKADATEAELVAAATDAQAHDFIASFPLGYDSEVGEFGSQLSLGQRQRVSVARALIKNAPIVLLDEPTSSLDSESERKVQEALRRLCTGKTTLVIAHRLNTIVDADCIHVVEQGKIVESGRHAELLRRGGRYATFFRLQFPEGHEQTAVAAE